MRPKIARPTGIRAVVLLALGSVLLAACGTTPATHHSAAHHSTHASAPPTGNPSSQVTLNEAGSTLIYPYLQVLAPEFNSAFSNATLAPGPGGSGLGINDAIGKLVQMGGSDAYLSPALAAANPTLLNIPIAISSQAVNYNVPGAPDFLKLSGTLLAQMYEGKITNWNDPKIAALNPGATLPNLAVVPVRRLDSSGDTFIFTSYLTATNSAWSSGPNEGTTVTWPPVSNELTANGNPAMIETCHGTPGCIAYIGVSVEDTAIETGLQEAKIENKSGSFLTPDQTDVTAAVAAAAGSTPSDLRQSLIYSPGTNSYPIVNFEYLMIQEHQSDSATAQAIRTFLDWAISPTGGATSGNLSAVNFVALPTLVIPKVETAINKITG
ncbi:MAG TPA: phosphate ABC transporter substrate-binding protein PstS [Candidatus Dormibacteraeota bacterium]|nr:phosphate ABC transporter substrate-binding protein PstS [Candidatus Dormibacteraeota bacterium]